MQGMDPTVAEEVCTVFESDTHANDASTLSVAMVDRFANQCLPDRSKAAAIQAGR